MSALERMADRVRRATGHEVQLEAGPRLLMVYGASTTACGAAAVELLQVARSLDPEVRVDHVYERDEDAPAESAYCLAIAIDWDRIASTGAA